MKALVKLTLVCISLMFFGIFVAQTDGAKVEKEAVVGIWLFDEGEGNIAKDSNNGHDGEIRGNVEWIEEGKFGSAISFPGIGGSRVNIPYKESLNLVTWSISMWVNLVDGGGWQYTFTKEGPQDTRNFFILTSDQGIVYTGFAGGGKWAEITSKTKLFDEEWHHLAGTYDKKTLRLYVDGTVEAQKPLTDTPVANEADVILGERFNGSAPVKGIIDELGLFNRGLTEDEVNNIMTNGLEETTGLAAISLKDKLAITWGEIKEIK